MNYRDDFLKDIRKNDGTRALKVYARTCDLMRVLVRCGDDKDLSYSTLKRIEQCKMKPSKTTSLIVNFILMKLTMNPMMGKNISEILYKNIIEYCNFLDPE